MSEHHDTIEQYETAVIGVGGLGSAALYHATLRNDGSVIGVEQFELGHLKGGSEGDSRIARGEQHHPDYAELARHGIAAWKQTGEEAGEKLFVPTGSLNLDTDGPYMQRLADSLDAVHRPEEPVPYQQLGPGEIMDRWPQFKVPDGMLGLYYPDSGLVNPTAANAAHIRMAHDNGAQLRERTTVESIELGDGSALVTTNTGRFEAQRLIITTGGWTAEVLRSVGIDLPLDVTQEQVEYYKPQRPEDFAIGNFPIWLLHQQNPEHPEAQQDHYYGFPWYQGKRSGTKASIDLGGQIVTDTNPRTFQPDERITNSIYDTVAPIIPGFGWENGAEVVTCQYALTRDRDFILDTLPGHPNVATAVLAGHGFKYLATLGAAMNQLVRGEPTPYSIDMFRLDRPAITDPNFPRTWHFGSSNDPRA